MEDFYNRLELLMKEQKVTRTKLSEDTNISYNTLTSMFQRKSKNMDLKTAKKMAKYLNTTLDYLINGNEQLKYIKDNYKTNTIITIKNNNEKELFKLECQDFDMLYTIIKKLGSNK